MSGRLDGLFTPRRALFSWWSWMEGLARASRRAPVSPFALPARRDGKGGVRGRECPVRGARARVVVPAAAAHRRSCCLRRPADGGLAWFARAAGAWASQSAAAHLAPGARKGKCDCCATGLMPRRPPPCPSLFSHSIPSPHHTHTHTHTHTHSHTHTGREGPHRWHHRQPGPGGRRGTGFPEDTPL